MHDFLIFYAPILVVIVSIAAAFMAALNTRFL
ncbi:cytochrome bd oxidase small subunit CydS [Lysinibacillus sp. LZ02]